MGGGGGGGGGGSLRTGVLTKFSCRKQSEREERLKRQAEEKIGAERGQTIGGTNEGGTSRKDRARWRAGETAR